MNARFPKYIGVHISRSTFLALDAKAGRLGLRPLVRKILDDYALQMILDKQNKYAENHKEAV